MVLSQSPFLAGCWLKASVPHRVGLCIGLLTTTACFSPKAERGMGEGVGGGKGEGRGGEERERGVRMEAEVSL